MAYVFYLIGILAVLLGGYLVASMWSPADAASLPYSAEVMLLGLAPGLGVMVVGFLFVGAGEVLVRLANIDRQTRRAADAAERTAEYVERQ